MNSAMHSPSLFIPRVFANIGETRIRKILEELNLGIISRIDLVSRTSEKGQSYNRAYVHFKSWNKDQGKVRERLLSGHEIKIVYDDPWFWKVSAYKKPEQKKAPHISFDCDEYGRDIPRPIKEPEVPELETSLRELDLDEKYQSINVNYGNHFVPKKRKLVIKSEQLQNIV